MEQSSISKVITHPRPELLLGSAPWGVLLPPQPGEVLGAGQAAALPSPTVLSTLSLPRFPLHIAAPGQPVPDGCCGNSRQSSWSQT